MLCEPWFWNLCMQEWIAISGMLGNGAIVITAMILYRQTRKSMDPPEIRKVRVHERIMQWNHPAFVSRRAGIHEYFSDHSISVKEKVERYTGNKKFREDTLEILSFFEALAQGISDGVLDEKSAARYFKTAAVPYAGSLKEIIKSIQRKHDDTIFSDFVALVKKWSS